MSLDIVHVLLSAQCRLAHDALGFGSGRRSQEWMLTSAAGVNGQYVVARLRFVHSSDVVTRAFLTDKLEIVQVKQNNLEN